MAALDLAHNVIQEVGLDSQVGSVRGDPFNTAPAARPRGLLAMASDFVMREVVKPSPWIRTPAGVVRWRPYGDPKHDLTPVIGVAVIGAGLATAAGMIALGAWLAKKAEAAPSRRRNPKKRRRR